MAVDFTPTQTTSRSVPFTPTSSLTPKPQQNLAQQIWGGLSGFVSGVEQPFVSLAATPVQAAAKLAGVPDPYANGVPTGLPGAGTNAKISPFSLPQKVGDLLKAAGTTLGIVSAPASIPAAAATGIGIGAAEGAGNALQSGAPGADVVKQAGIGAAVGGLTGGAAAGIGQLLGKVGDFGLKNLVKPTKADVADGFSLDTIKQYNLGGTLYQMQDKTQSAINGLSTQLRQKLAASNTTIDLNDVLKQTVEDITSSGSKLKTFGANTRMETAVNQLSNEVSAIDDEGSVSIPDAQIIKQAAGQFGSWQYGKVDPDAKASEVVYNTFYNKLKTAIEENAPAGVKDINQQLSKLIPVSNAIVRRIPVAERQSPLSLTDFIGLTASTFEPHALGVTLLNFLSKSGPVASQLIKAPTVGHVLAPYASFGASQVNESSNTSSPQQGGE